MMSKRRSNEISVDTLIGKNTYFEGNIKSDGTIRIDGKIKGEIESKGDVVVGESGSIIGNIECMNVIISGSVEGNVIAREQLRLTPTAKLVGDIKMNSLITDEGASFTGNCGMVDKAPQLTGSTPLKLDTATKKENNK